MAYPTTSEGALKNHDGQLRQVGVEIEFAALSAEAAAKLVQNLFGGELSKIDTHRYQIKNSEVGDFITELDAQYVHGQTEKQSSRSDGQYVDKLNEFRDLFRELMGNVSALIVPCEVVCPPVAIQDLHKINQLVKALKGAGAEGTNDNPFYAFGVQLNPEIAEKKAAYIVSVLKAYLLVSDWLRREIGVDITRRVLPFADPFPVDYALYVTDPSYWPETDQLIDDYLAYNPTRNRELDMLPLFAWLDEDRVFEKIPDPRIKKRPTFHYRLPDARFGDAEWDLILEWERWQAVERLSEDKEKLKTMAYAFAENQGRLVPSDWAALSQEWIGPS